MFGEIIPLIIISGFLAPYINSNVTLGRNIIGLYKDLQHKGDQTQTEKDFVNLAPIAKLVQKKLLIRVIAVALAIIIACAIVLFASGKIFATTGGIEGTVDLITGIIGISLSSVLTVRRNMNKLFIHEEELAIIKEFNARYFRYIKEVRQSLGVTTANDKFVLDHLGHEKSHAKTLVELMKELSGASEPSINKDEIYETVNYLVETGRVKTKGFRTKRYYKTK